jgi:hypothetical protein
MTAKQARALRVGDRVRDNLNWWDGTVLERGPDYIMIEWDGATPAPRSHLHPADLDDITLHRCTVCMREHSRCDCEPVPASFQVGDRIVRTDSPCKPGKVLRITDVEALVIWGMDLGSGDKPQWEPIVALDLAADAQAYAASRLEATEGCERCRRGLPCMRHV